MGQCLGSKSHAAADAASGAGHGPARRRTGAGRRGKTRPRRTSSPVASERPSAQGGSVYFDADAGGDGDFGSFDDGQFFFGAEDDPGVSDATFAGIPRCPPRPAAAPDAARASPASVGHPDARRPAPAHEQSRCLVRDAAPTSSRRLLTELTTPNVREKGFPGELTDEELDAVKRFRAELRTRDPIYKQIVGSLGAVEKEAYALCRFLRARQFDVDKVFALLDEAKPHYAVARENDFYPDLERALGFSRAAFMSQYPAIFAGNARNGCPVLYFRLGAIRPEGLRCMLSLEKVERFFWNDYMYAFAPFLAAGRKVNPNCARAECITVYDLKGLSRAQVSADVFEVIKSGARVMTSFPETLHCLLIINAPSWFGLIWSVAKKLIDARTASKITVFTNAKAGDKRMQELIDGAQIPSCYGGTGPSLAAAAAAGPGAAPGAPCQRVVLNELLFLTKRAPDKSHAFELDAGQRVTLVVYTRCKTGATATVRRAEGGTVVAAAAIAGDTEDEPYSTTVGAVAGPGSFTVHVRAHATVPCVFLVLGSDHAGDRLG